MSVMSGKIGWLQGSMTHNEIQLTGRYLSYQAAVEFRWNKIVLDSKDILVILR